MSSQEIFDSRYVADSATTSGGVDPAPKIKDFLKDPLAAQDLKQYGTSKPSRVIIRASLQYGESGEGREDPA